MKILHTSDWHLGKRLPPFSREDEQRQVMDEICEIARRESVDVTVIAGDIFDVSLPSAAAEELFFTSALKLSATCLVVAIAGNHDDGERLNAPSSVAKYGNIILAGGYDCRALGMSGIEAREGGIIYCKDGQRLNLCLVPYVSQSRRGDAPTADFAQYVKDVIAGQCATVFGDDGFNMLVTHLFMLGGQSGSEERELGAAKILPISVLPDCDYVALGHIHKPMKVADNAYYSGSVLNYSFGEKTSKEVVIIDTQTRQIKHVPLSSGRALVTVKADSFESAMAAMEQNAGAFVKIVYDCVQPLSASQTAALSAAGSLAELEIVPQNTQRERTKRAHRSPQQLFEEYYASCYGGEKPDEELAAEFCALLEEGE